MRAFLALLLMAGAVQAEACGPHDAVAAMLKRDYGETAQVQAVAQDGRLMEIYANAATGSWTAIMTKPDGTACVVAGGKQYRVVKPGEPA